MDLSKQKQIIIESHYHPLIEYLTFKILIELFHASSNALYLIIYRSVGRARGF